MCVKRSKRVMFGLLIIIDIINYGVLTKHTVSIAVINQGNEIKVFYLSKSNDHQSNLIIGE